MEDQSGEGVPIAEPSETPIELVWSGEAVGQIDGLIWSDASGLDVLSVTFGGAHIAVPFEPEWREHDQLDVSVDPLLLQNAPLVSELRELGPSNAIDAVGRHFLVNLAGPPPGPNPGPLPPWWSTGDESEAGPALGEPR